MLTKCGGGVQGARAALFARKAAAAMAWLRMNAKGILDAAVTDRSGLGGEQLHAQRRQWFAGGMMCHRHAPTSLAVVYGLAPAEVCQHGRVSSPGSRRVAVIGDGVCREQIERFVKGVCVHTSCRTCHHGPCAKDSSNGCKGHTPNRKEPRRCRRPPAQQHFTTMTAAA